MKDFERSDTSAMTQHLHFAGDSIMFPMTTKFAMLWASWQQTKMASQAKFTPTSKKPQWNNHSYCVITVAHNGNIMVGSVGSIYLRQQWCQVRLLGAPKMLFSVNLGIYSYGKCQSPWPGGLVNLVPRASLSYWDGSHARPNFNDFSLLRSPSFKNTPTSPAIFMYTSLSCNTVYWPKLPVMFPARYFSRNIFEYPVQSPTQLRPQSCKWLLNL